MIYPQSKPFTFDRVVRILITVGALIVVVWLINLLKDVLLPFCVACLIAYMLEPLVGINQKVLKMPKRRGLPVFVTLFETTLIIGIISYFFIPSITNEIDHLKMLLKTYADSGTRDADEFSQLVHQYINPDMIARLIDSDHLSAILDKGTSIVSTGVEIVMHTIEWLLTFVYIIFIMLDYDHITKGFKLLVPPRWRKPVYRVGNDIKVSMNVYFRNQALLALCAAVFYCIGFSIIKLPLAIVMGITVGILYMIPYFQYITLIPVAILCLITSMSGGENFWPMIGKVLLVYAISQSICDYILTPKIMGKAMGLNPAIILLSLSVWGTLLGLIGMIIALPLTTLLMAYYKEYVIDRPAAAELDDLTQERMQ